MGSGKSTVGKLLAERLNWDFKDLDSVVEQRVGLSVNKIFHYYGEDAFRRVESAALNSILATENVVISTGGGVPCFFDNMEVMLSNGEVFYLEVNHSILAERLNKDALTVRPLVKGKTKEQLNSFIERHLDERKAYYERAHQIQDASYAPEQVAERIAESL